MAGRRSQKLKPGHILEYALFRFFETLFRFLPPAWVDALGLWLGGMAYHILPRRRRIARRNCRIAWGESLDDAALDALTRETFRHAGANLLGGIRCMLLSDEQIKRHVSIVGAELVRESLASQPNGVIYALAHMGNWEILARIGSLIVPGVPKGAFFRPLNNPLMNRMTIRRRQQSGTQLFSNKESFNLSCDLLRRGGMLGILSDQHAGGSGCLTTFFGRTTPCSPLVELLHRRIGATVFFFSVKRDAPAHWQVTITGHDPGKTVSTRSIMQGVEEALSRSPADGFWLHNRWKHGSKRPLDHSFARQSLEGITPTKPWRYAIVQSADPAIAAAAAPAIEHLKRALPDTELHHISAKPEENLVETLRQLDAQKSYPLDLVIYFCPLLARESPHRRAAIPMAAGFGEQNKSLNSRVALPASTMDDPQTWWEFLRTLGCPMPATEP